MEFAPDKQQMEPSAVAQAYPGPNMPGKGAACSRWVSWSCWRSAGHVMVRLFSTNLFKQKGTCGSGQGWVWAGRQAAWEAATSQVKLNKHQGMACSTPQVVTTPLDSNKHVALLNLVKQESPAHSPVNGGVDPRPQEGADEAHARTHHGTRQRQRCERLEGASRTQQGC